jgi:hypothetical protein
MRQLLIPSSIDHRISMVEMRDVTSWSRIAGCCVRSVWKKVAESRMFSMSTEVKEALPCGELTDDGIARLDG